MQIRRAQPSETQELKRWIAEQHYLESAPPGFIHLLEFVDGNRRIGGMIVGRPHAKAYNPDRVVQLHRVFFIDETPRFVESQGLSLMRKHIRVWLPQIRLLLSYSDPEQGHMGTIYEADGWCELGMTREDHQYGWGIHRGRNRTEGRVSAKVRWVRTP